MSAAIRIRFTDTNSGPQTLGDLEVPRASAASTSAIRNYVRSQVQYCANRRLRLIYNGRVLNETTDVAKEIVGPRERQAVRSPAPEPGENVIYIHCVVGDVLSSSELAHENDMDQHTAPSTAPQVIGFDRLLQQGFSEQDVADLRAQFSRIYDQTASSGTFTDLEEEEERQHRLRQLEEQWIEAAINPGPAPVEASAQADETNVHTVPPASDPETHFMEDLLLGSAIGIFLGALSIVILAIDDTMFNKHQKVAIVVGLGINWFVSLFRGQWWA